MIIGLSGRKQAGKSTCCNFLYGFFMWYYGIIEQQFTINDEGKLIISDLFGDTTKTGIFDTSIPDPGLQQFIETHLNPLVRVYSFADRLKQQICVETLGLDPKQVYGTNEDKDSLTDLRWENMPGVCTNLDAYTTVTILDPNINLYYHEPGQMTAREVLQYVGTEVFRRMYPDVWSSALISTIKRDKTERSLIADVRFPNEAQAIQKEGGIIIRLTRNPFPDNDHESETAMDNYGPFDFTIDNEEMTIIEQNAAVLSILRKCGVEGVPACI